MYAKLLITNKSKENNVQYIFSVADDYQKVVETHHTVSLRFIDKCFSMLSCSTWMDVGLDFPLCFNCIYISC